MQVKSFSDQMGQELSIPFPPARIISLVPSQTELLFDLGLKDEIVGITKFCIHPENQFKVKEKIGGTKKLDIAKIIALKPDILIGNKEENEEGQINELMKHFPVWMSDIKTLGDALEMISALGELTGKQTEAEQIEKNVKDVFALLPVFSRQKVVYLIWKDPYMAAGADTFIDDMLKRCGLTNVVVQSRYPEIDLAQLKALNPQLIFLSSEPYPFKEKHIGEFKMICPDASVQIVDGELFSWYGSRLQKAPAYFQELAAEW